MPRKVNGRSFSTAATEKQITGVVSRFRDPRARLLAVFEGQGELFAMPGLRGCTFVDATAGTATGSSVGEVAGEYRKWLRALLVELASEAGVTQSEALARQLHLLYDGAGLSARMDHDPEAAAHARTAAAALLDAALAAQES